MIPPAPAAIGYRWAGVLLAPAVAVAVHLILVGPLGLELRLPKSPGSDQLQDLPLLTTFLFTLGIGLAGWLTIVVLQRFFGLVRGRRLWMVLAFAVLALSLVPVAVLDIPTEAKWGLVALHVIVALVLIPTLSSASPAEPLHRGQGQLPPDSDDPDEPEPHGTPQSHGTPAHTTTHTTTTSDRPPLADERPPLTDHRPLLTDDRPPLTTDQVTAPAEPDLGPDPVADDHPLSHDRGHAG